VDEEYPTFAPNSVNPPAPAATFPPAAPATKPVVSKVVPAKIKSDRKTSNRAAPVNTAEQFYTPNGSIRTQSQKIVLKKHLGDRFRYTLVFAVGLALGLVIGLVIAILT
jgi:hypothetical protein